MLLTQEEEKYYETYFDLFLTSGWKQLTEEVLHFEGGIKRSYDIIKEREAEK